MACWCWNGRRDFLGHFSLLVVVGSILVVEGACLVGIVIRWRFLEIFYFFDFLELMKEVGVLVW